MYIVDSSSLINIDRRLPEKIFPGAWQLLSDLVNNGRLIAPVEVNYELTRGSDEVCKWVDSNEKCFKKDSDELFEKVKEIQSLFPLMADPNSPHHADPFLVALVLLQKNQDRFEKSEFCLLTDEKGTGVEMRDSNLKDIKKIPDVCRYYQINCLDHLSFIQKEGWKIQ